MESWGYLMPFPLKSFEILFLIVELKNEIYKTAHEDKNDRNNRRVAPGDFIGQRDK
jgi:hypothetical protein